MKTSVKNHRVGARVGRGRIARAMAALAFVGLFTAACKDATGPETLSSLTVSPATQTVAVGGTVQLGATGVRAGIDARHPRAAAQLQLAGAAGAGEEPAARSAPAGALARL